MRGQPRDCRPWGTASAGEGYLLCAAAVHTRPRCGGVVSGPPRGVEQGAEAAEGPWLARCPGWRAQSWDCTSAAPHGLSGQSHPSGLRAPHR